MRQGTLMVAALVLASGCGGNDDNDDTRSVVAGLPSLEGVELVGSDYYDYCSGDACPRGNDRSAALLTYEVDGERYSQDSLVEAYRGELGDWSASIDEGCANADPSFCDEIVFASFARGDSRIDLNLDNWDLGRFDLHVDTDGGD